MIAPTLLARVKNAAEMLPRPARRLWGYDSTESALPGADTEIARLFRTSPEPLIHPRARMAVIFSAKSACSSVAIWFLNQLGHREAARDYHPFPHKYRSEVYYRSQLYADALRGDLTKLRVVRVVRDPFRRAVSSYRHVLARGLVDGQIAKMQRRRDVGTNGFSFAEFLDLLEVTDLTSCNMHYRIQRHPLEDVLPVHHLIDISTEDLFTRLNEVEADLGLPRTNFAEIPWIERVNDRRTARGSVDDLTNADRRRFTTMAARKGPWAPYDAFLTPAARERIARLYAVDIASYFQKPPAALTDGAGQARANRQAPQPAGAPASFARESRS